MIKVLDHLIHKTDVLSIICGYAKLYEDEDEDIYNILDSLYDTINRLTEINVVEAGDINILCEYPENMAKFLEGRKNNG